MFREAVFHLNIYIYILSPTPHSFPNSLSRSLARSLDRASTHFFLFNTTQRRSLLHTPPHTLHQFTHPIISHHRALSFLRPTNHFPTPTSACTPIHDIPRLVLLKSPSCHHAVLDKFRFISLPYKTKQYNTTEHKTTTWASLHPTNTHTTTTTKIMTVRDPTFWHRFSIAVHQDEATKDEEKYVTLPTAHPLSHPPSQLCISQTNKLTNKKTPDPPGSPHSERKPASGRGCAGRFGCACFLLWRAWWW